MEVVNLFPLKIGQEPVAGHFGPHSYQQVSEPESASLFLHEAHATSALVAFRKWVPYFGYFFFTP